MSPLIECPQAEDVGRQSSVHCKLERFGGFPHLGVCRARCGHGKGHAIVRAGFADERAALCMACAEPCPLKSLTPCQRTARLRQRAMACPLDKWAAIADRKEEKVAI